MVGIFPNDTAIVRLVDSQLLEQQEECQLERGRFFSEATMDKIPEPDDALELTDGEPAEEVAGVIPWTAPGPPLDLHRIPRSLSRQFSDHGSQCINVAAQPASSLSSCGCPFSASGQGHRTS